MLYCTVFNLSGRSRLLLNSGREKMKYLPDYQCVLLQTLCGCFFSYSSADKGENVLFRLLFASLQRYFVAKVSEM